MDKNVNSKEQKRIQRFENGLLILFTLIIVFVTIFLTSVILDRSAKAIKKNTSDLIAANSKQLQININSYLDKVETIVALLFSDENYYKYDATDKSLDDYTKIQYENNIQNRIVDLGIMQNFSDFVIVYADNHTVGWLSSTTRSSFEELYSDFEAKISNDMTDDGWFLSENDDIDRLYYVKRLNKNALLVASFYTRELASAFEISDELSDMIIRLVDDNSQILYSSEKDEIGNYVPDDIKAHFTGDDSQMISSDDYIINLNTCENGWHVVCTIPTAVVLEENNELQSFAINFALIVACVIIIIGVFLFSRLARPMDSMVSDLSHQAVEDKLSGFLNKMAFEEHVEEKLKECKHGEGIAFAIFDVDHFKTINDTLGHAYGDKVIERTAAVVGSAFGNTSVIGRIGGDEFAVLYNAESENVADIRKELAGRLEQLSAAFLNEFEKEHKSCGVSISAGASVFEYNNESFDDIYKAADSALYVSKEHGRNQYTFYREGMRHE